MTSVQSLFPSKWLAASDLEGSDQIVEIKQVTPAEEVGQSKDIRPILYFVGVQKGMVLNKTNAKRIAKLFGNDVEKWVGKSITLYPSECDFRDETVPCIRVRPDAPEQTKHDDDDLDEEERAAIEAVRKKKAAKKAAAT